MKKPFFKNPLFNSVKLYPGEQGENDNQTDKEKKGFRSCKIGLFRRLIGTVYEKYQNEVYEVAKHKKYVNLSTLIIGASQDQQAIPSVVDVSA